MKGLPFALLTSCLLLTACAAKDEGPNIDTSLYTGKPIDTLTSDAPPLNEKEAIQRADIALNNNNFDLALYEYIRSLTFANAKMKDRSLYNIGRIHQARGNFPLAEKAYLMAIEENPNNVQVLEQLGSLYTKSGDVSQGATYFYRALNADQLRLGSNVTVNKHNLIESQKVNTLEIDNASPQVAYIGLGVLEDVKANHELAQAFYNQALKINPHSQKALINVGYSYYMSGDYQLAQRFTLSALEKDTDNEKALNNLALIYLGKGEVKRALNVFQKQMDVPEALNNVGYFLMLQGQPEKAIPYLKQAIDKKPTYYRVANENLERALAMVREEQSEP